MSVIRMIGCDVCEKKVEASSLPDDWTLLSIGHDDKTLHFCMPMCLARWAIGNLAFTPDLSPEDAALIASGYASWLKLGRSGVPPQLNDTPPTKMRRFLLVDGETADEIEGVKWGNGSVSICTLSDWISWDSFKQSHDGSGIQWIDPEVSDAK